MAGPPDRGPAPTTAHVPFRDLPVLPASGIRHSWDVFGRDDQVGTLNRTTPATVLDGLGAARTGEVVNLSLPISLPDPPLFGRQPTRVEIFPTGRNTWDDRIDGLYPQASTQWDGLRHVRAREDGFYGGWTGDPAEDRERLGVQHWARKGVVGRGVLIDLPALPKYDLATFDPFASEAVEVADLETALERQGVTLSAGDVLCLRTGWMDRYLATDPAQRATLATEFEKHAGRSWVGLRGNEEMSEFLWDSGLVAVACDNPALEVAPGDPADGSLHRRLIPGMGFAVGELFDLTALAEACARRGAFDFLFVSPVLAVPGGVGSPACALAVL